MLLIQESAGKGGTFHFHSVQHIYFKHLES